MQSVIGNRLAVARAAMKSTCLQLRSLLLHFHIIYSWAYICSCISAFIQFSYIYISRSNLALLRSQLDVSIAFSVSAFIELSSVFPLFHLSTFATTAHILTDKCTHTHMHTHILTHSGRLAEIPSKWATTGNDAADASFVLRIA